MHPTFKNMTRLASAEYLEFSKELRVSRAIDMADLSKVQAIYYCWETCKIYQDLGKNRVKVISPNNGESFVLTMEKSDDTTIKKGQREKSPKASSKPRNKKVPKSDAQ